MNPGQKEYAKFTALRRFGRPGLYIALAAYLWLSFSDIYGPGLAYEELDEAVFVTDIFAGKYPGATTCVTLFGLHLPLTATTNYMGALQTYLLMPLFLLFGPTVFSVRLLAVLAGAGTLAAGWLAIELLFGPAVAALTAALLVLQPAYLLFTKMGNSDNILNLGLALVMLFYARWLGRKRNIDLYLAAFTAGLALWTKIVFIWAILGIVLAHLLFFRTENRTSRGPVLRALLCFFAGLFPLILANVITGGSTVKRILRYAFAPAAADGEVRFVDNSAFFGNLSTRIRHFDGLFGGYDFDVFGPFGRIDAPRTFAWIFAAALAWWIFDAVKSGGKEEGRRRGLALVLFSSIFLGLCFTVSGFRTKHMFFLAPLPQLILAGFIAGTYRSARKAFGRAAAVTPAFALFLLLAWPNVKIISRYRAPDFGLNGYDNSSASYDAAKFLLSAGAAKIYIIDRHWRLGRVVTFISGGRIEAAEVFPDDSSSAAVSLPDEFLLLSFVEPVTGDESPYLRWAGEVRSGRFAPEKLRIFPDRSGRPILALYTVRRAK